MQRLMVFVPGLATGVFGILLLAWFSLQPNPPQKLLAVFPPDTTTPDIIGILGQTDSLLVGPAALPFAFILQSDDPNIIDALHNAGAVTVLNAANIGGCSGRKKGKFNESV